jgi:hypothetical protein
MQAFGNTMQAVLGGFKIHRAVQTKIAPHAGDAKPEQVPSVVLTQIGSPPWFAQKTLNDGDPFFMGTLPQGKQIITIRNAGFFIW